MSNVSQYERQIGVQENDSLTKIVKLVRAGSRVLDLGTGPGALGEYLTRFKSCRVDGVERLRQFADQARFHYERIFLCDIEQVDLAALLGPIPYDYIVCADVLEHLANPEAVLRQLPQLLSPAGRVLISMPNVSYAGLVAELAAGQFQYRDNGLLDRTHLRFFTWESLAAMISACGLFIVSTDTITLPLDQSEFAAAAAADYLNLDKILARPHALTYQFIVEAAPA